MEKALVVEDMPADAAQIRVEIERIFAEIDRSIERIQRDEEEFARMAAETNAVLKQIQQQLQTS